MDARVSIAAPPVLQCVSCRAVKGAPAFTQVLQVGLPICMQMHLPAYWGSRVVDYLGLGRLGGQLLSLVYLTLGRVALCVRVYL